MKRELKIILTACSLIIIMVVTIGFASVRNQSKPVHDILVTIKEQNGNFFTDQLEVINLLNAENTDYVLGLSIGELDLKVLEERVEVHPFIEDAQIFRDIKGNLSVTVVQNQPIARILDIDGPDQYIDMKGNLLPTTARHTARVPIIEMERNFSWESNISETEYGQKILTLLLYIDKDDFWRAQIAHLVIEKDGEITMLPQVTKQEIVFGMPDQLETKFRKLKLFYKEILPNKGWNTYELVNLKFENQIVCE